LEWIGAVKLKSQVFIYEEWTLEWVALKQQVFFVGLLIVFLLEISLEIPDEIFLAICARETLINEWDTWGTDINEGLNFLGWIGQEEES